MPSTKVALTEAYMQLTPGAEKAIKSVFHWWRTHKLSAHEVLATVQSFAASSVTLRKILATDALWSENADPWFGLIAMPNAKGEASKEQVHLLKQISGRTDSAVDSVIDARRDSPAVCSTPRLFRGQLHPLAQTAFCTISSCVFSSAGSTPVTQDVEPQCPVLSRRHAPAVVVMKPGGSQRQLAAAPDANYNKTLGKCLREQRAQLVAAPPDASYFKALRNRWTRRFDAN